METSLLKQLNAARAARQAAVTWTRLSSGEQGLFVQGHGSAPDDLAEAIEARLRSGKSGMAGEGAKQAFVNVHVPSPRLVVIGAVHISQALAPIARLAEFDVTIIDPRTAFATQERFPDVDLIADWPQEVLPANPLDPYTALAAVTHDPKIDDFPITEALKAQCFYIGALGSRKTHATRIERLIEAGADPAALERIHAPIGLDIGAASPQEIAVAVMAEVIGAFRRRDVGLKSLA